MFPTSSTVIRSARPEDLLRLANLIHFEAFVHRHLDYRPPLDWIGQEPFLVLEQGNRIEAALACPPDPPVVAWLRLFAVSSRVPPLQAWEALWSKALDRLSQDPQLDYAAAIPLYTWFESILKRSNFIKTNSIVMLRMDVTGLPEKAPDKRIIIRPLEQADLKQVEVIDHMSFSPMWMISGSYLEAAFRQSLIATVAQIDDKVVGYQISTGSPTGGHLARLAVMPSKQREGIGYALVFDLIRQFARRAARTITVNTQKDNQASLALYQKSGFELTGEEYPCYQLDLHG